MSEENKRIIEIPFDKNREILILITKRFLQPKEVEAWLKLINTMMKSKIFIFPSELVEEIKVIRRIDK